MRSLLALSEVMGTGHHAAVSDGVVGLCAVFDFETDLDGIAEAYAAMDERRAIKSIVRVRAI